LDNSETDKPLSLVSANAPVVGPDEMGYITGGVVADEAVARFGKVLVLNLTFFPVNIDKLVLKKMLLALADANVPGSSQADMAFYGDAVWTYFISGLSFEAERSKGMCTAYKVEWTSNQFMAALCKQCNIPKLMLYVLGTQAGSNEHAVASLFEALIGVVSWEFPSGKEMLLRYFIRQGCRIVKPLYVINDYVVDAFFDRNPMGTNPHMSFVPSGSAKSKIGSDFGSDKLIDFDQLKL
jgi:hypothetical protein